MNFGVVGSAGMEGVDIDGYILPDASHIVTDGKNEIGRRAIDYAARRKISCKIETNKRKLMESVDAIIMFWKSLDEELTEYMRICDETGVANTVFLGKELMLFR